MRLPSIRGRTEHLVSSTDPHVRPDLRYHAWRLRGRGRGRRCSPRVPMLSHREFWHFRAQCFCSEFQASVVLKSVKYGRPYALANRA